MKKAVLIIAGGIGERLWPLSRENKPKQFLTIVENKTLIEQTIDRALRITDEDSIFIVTGKRYKEAFSKYIPSFKKENIIYEPAGRDTAAAIGLAMILIEEKIGNAIITILPADPIIRKEDLYIKAIENAIDISRNTNNIVIIGVNPDRAETGYGYIKIKDNIAYDVYNVDKFIEKPNYENACRFLEDGNYLWNSGMFIWSIDNIIKSIKTLIPDTYNKIIETLKNKNDDEKLKIFNTIDKISFDFGIMEKLTNIICIKSHFFWDDLGAFSALGRIHNKDSNKNVIVGNVYAKESNGNIIINDDKKTFIAADGIHNLTIVKSDNVLLIYPNNEDSKIKEILKDIREKDELKDNRNLL
ncbi:mannose-1-phosphate guanylyltransferase [uncultured Brachyspira sp.]|uniref:mannose-1-phosphate guanylyltransferase n=1 Tax=uncultured Brachyspira sp. TaxID=221953 RepID=UPI0025F8DB50|nr:sugar phosphate nucleotidyltransferase [uncultured Brachyspira sp.]